MELFDCNCWFGVAGVPPLRYAETVPELLEEMSFCGVSKALVYHIAERDDSPLAGNPITVEHLAGHPPAAGVMYPVWALLPSQTGEQPPVDEFLGSMREHGSTVLRSFPKQHQYLLNGNTFGPLLEAMVAAHIPLIAEADWPIVTALLHEFPDLTLIAVSVSCWGQDRFFRPLLEKYRNLYLETSRYELDGGIRDFCRSYGPDQLLFGTGFPDSNMGGAVLTLLQAEIPEESREAIGAGNLRRILGEVRL